MVGADAQLQPHPGTSARLGLNFARPGHWPGELVGLSRNLQGLGSGPVIRGEIPCRSLKNPVLI